MPGESGINKINNQNILTVICRGLNASDIWGWACCRVELNCETEMSPPLVGTDDVSTCWFAIVVTEPVILLTCCDCKPRDESGLCLACDGLNWLWFNVTFREVDNWEPDGGKRSEPRGNAEFVWTVTFGGAIRCWFEGAVRLDKWGWGIALVTGSSEKYVNFSSVWFIIK